MNVLTKIEIQGCVSIYFFFFNISYFVVGSCLVRVCRLKVKGKEIQLLKRTSGPGGQLKFSLLLSTNSQYQPTRRLRSFCALQLLNVPATAERRGAGDQQLNAPTRQTGCIPSGAKSPCVGVCLARWTTSSCAGTWGWGWRRSWIRTAAAGTLTSRLTRRSPAGSSGRRSPQPAPLLFITTPHCWGRASLPKLKG